MPQTVRLDYQEMYKQHTRKEAPILDSHEYFIHESSGLDVLNSLIVISDFEDGAITEFNIIDDQVNYGVVGTYPIKVTFMDSDKNLVGNFTLMDSDGDGVTDDIDQCNSTPSGQTVNSNGCSDSQKDTDGDGVTDDVDTCPDTPSGETVDSNGCSDSQKDTDGDGVSDDVDTCSETPEGEDVDENGCSEILISDSVFGDVLTRLGYPVINGKMKHDDALRIENLIITSKIGFYGEADSNGTSTFENNFVPDGGSKVGYTNEGEYISNTSGLKYFHNLKTIRLEFQHFTEINLSNLYKLELFSFWGNPISDIDISNNINLKFLGLSETGLSSIDFTGLDKLEEVAIQLKKNPPYNITNGNKTFTVNGISSLNFNDNGNLQRIYVHYNPINDLGIGVNNTNLTEIWAYGTDIDSLTLSGFEKLNYVILNKSDNLEYLNLCDMYREQVAQRLYCEECPRLEKILVNNVDAYQQKKESGIGIHFDSHIFFEECD